MASEQRHMAAIWDLDGVLVDTMAPHFQAWQATLAELGRPLTEAEFRATFGRTSPDVIRALLGSEVPPEEVQRIAEAKEQRFRALLKASIQAQPGAVELLRGLAAHSFRQAIASSAPRANVEPILERLAVRQVFQALVSGDDIRRGKPDPEIFLLAARWLRVEPRWCIVLEDAIDGVAAARAAGMRCLAVTTTNPRERLSAANRVVGSLAEVKPEELVALLQS